MGMNILGFHLTAKLQPRQEKAITENFNLEQGASVRYQERLYRSRGEEGKEEEVEEEEEVVGMDSLDGIPDQERMEGRDLRVIVRAEEELSQCVGFTRLLPRPGGLTFLKYLVRPHHDDL